MFYLPLPCAMYNIKNVQTFIVSIVLNPSLFHRYLNGNVYNVYESVLLIIRDIYLPIFAYNIIISAFRYDIFSI